MDYINNNPTPVLKSTKRSGGFSRSVSFLNLTGIGINVNFADGQRVLIPTTSNSLATGKFYITIEYTIENRCTLVGLENALSEKEYERLLELPATNRSNPILEYELAPADILTAGKSYYCPELCVALTAENIPGWHYPNTEYDAEQHISNGCQSSFEMRVIVVDSVGSVTGKWGRYGEYVFEIQHTTGTGLPDGFYFYSTHGGEKNVTRYELDADSIPYLTLFGSRQNALSYLDTMTVETIAIEKDKLAAKKVELEREVLDSKQRLATMTEEYAANERILNAQHEAEKRKLEAEAMNRKDMYDERSTMRKDTSESIKWLPSIIAALGATIAIFSKV